MIFFMDSFVVYVLWSERYLKTYTGVTSNLISRFLSHNRLGTKGWTVRYRPWRVVFVKFFANKKDALLFEKYLKTGAGRDWLKSNVDFN
jgi:putative endonuclease